jgi:hypothetical protein
MSIVGNCVSVADTESAFAPNGAQTGTHLMYQPADSILRLEQAQISAA